MALLPKTFCQSNLFVSGFGGVVIARYKSGGRVEAGVFLLDMFCMGVKNAFFVRCHESEVGEVVERACAGGSSDPATEHSGAWGRKLIEDGVTYARRLGFAPHPDYKQAARVMGGINPKECSETFVFGSAGKPMFIAGPNDSEAKCKRIVNILTKKLGPPPAFDYLGALAGSDDFFTADENADEAE